MFWDMWRGNPYAFSGILIAQALESYYTAGILPFLCTPTPLFCSEQGNPCSCSGGGFELYKPLCAKVSGTSNGSSSSNITQMAEREYVIVPDFLTKNLGTFVATAVAVVAVGVGHVGIGGVEREGERERERDRPNPPLPTLHPR